MVVKTFQLAVNLNPALLSSVLEICWLLNDGDKRVLMMSCSQHRCVINGAFYATLRPLPNSQRIRKIILELLDTERQYVRVSESCCRLYTIYFPAHRELLGLTASSARSAKCYLLLHNQHNYNFDTFCISESWLKLDKNFATCRGNIRHQNILMGWKSHIGEGCLSEHARNRKMAQCCSGEIKPLSNPPVFFGDNQGVVAVAISLSGQ